MVPPPEPPHCGRMRLDCGGDVYASRRPRRYGRVLHVWRSGYHMVILLRGARLHVRGGQGPVHRALRRQRLPLLRHRVHAGALRTSVLEKESFNCIA